MKCHFFMSNMNLISRKYTTFWPLGILQVGLNTHSSLVVVFVEMMGCLFTIIEKASILKTLQFSFMCQLSHHFLSHLVRIQSTFLLYKVSNVSLSVVSMNCCLSTFCLVAGCPRQAGTQNVFSMQIKLVIVHLKKTFSRKGGIGHEREKAYDGNRSIALVIHCLCIVFLPW